MIARKKNLLLKKTVKSNANERQIILSKEWTNR